MGNKKTKFVQTAATIRKRHNYIRRIMDENGNWSIDQNFVLQVFHMNTKNVLKRIRIATFVWLSLYPQILQISIILD